MDTFDILPVMLNTVIKIGALSKSHVLYQFLEHTLRSALGEKPNLDDFPVYLPFLLSLYHVGHESVIHLMRGLASAGRGPFNFFEARNLISVHPTTLRRKLRLLRASLRKKLVHKCLAVMVQAEPEPAMAEGESSRAVPVLVCVSVDAMAIAPTLRFNNEDKIFGFPDPIDAEEFYNKFAEATSLPPDAAFATEVAVAVISNMDRSVVMPVSFFGRAASGNNEDIKRLIAGVCSRLEISCLHCFNNNRQCDRPHVIDANLRRKQQPQPCSYCKSCKHDCHFFLPIAVSMDCAGPQLKLMEELHASLEAALLPFPDMEHVLKCLRSALFNYRLFYEGYYISLETIEACMTVDSDLALKLLKLVKNISHCLRNVDRQDAHTFTAICHPEVVKLLPDYEVAEVLLPQCIYTGQASLRPFTAFTMHRNRMVLASDEEMCVFMFSKTIPPRAISKCPEPCVSLAVVDNVLVAASSSNIYAGSAGVIVRSTKFSWATVEVRDAPHKLDRIQAIREFNNQLLVLANGTIFVCSLAPKTTSDINYSVTVQATFSPVNVEFSGFVTDAPDLYMLSTTGLVRVDISSGWQSPIVHRIETPSVSSASFASGRCTKDSLSFIAVRDQELIELCVHRQSFQVTSHPFAGHKPEAQDPGQLRRASRLPALTLAQPQVCAVVGKSVIFSDVWGSNAVLRLTSSCRPLRALLPLFYQVALAFRIVSDPAVSHQTGAAHSNFVVQSLQAVVDACDEWERTCRSLKGASLKAVLQGPDGICSSATRKSFRMLLTSFFSAQSIIVRLGFVLFRLNAAAFTTSAVEHFFAVARSRCYQGNMPSLYEFTVFFETIVHEFLKKFTDCGFHLNTSRSGHQSYSLPADKKPKYIDLFQLLDSVLESSQSDCTTLLASTTLSDAPSTGMSLESSSSDASTPASTIPVSKLPQDKRARIHHLCGSLAPKVPQKATRQVSKANPGTKPSFVQVKDVFILNGRTFKPVLSGMVSKEGEEIVVTNGDSDEDEAACDQDPDVEAVPQGDPAAQPRHEASPASAVSGTLTYCQSTCLAIRDLEAPHGFLIIRTTQNVYQMPTQTKLVAKVQVASEFEDFTFSFEEERKIDLLQQDLVVITMIASDGCGEWQVADEFELFSWVQSSAIRVSAKRTAGKRSATTLVIPK